MLIALRFLFTLRSDYVVRKTTSNETVIKLKEIKALLSTVEAEKKKVRGISRYFYFDLDIVNFFRLTFHYFVSRP